MKKSLNLAVLAAVFFAAAVPAFSQQGLSEDTKQQIKEVQDAIKKTGAKWTAGETSVSYDRENWPNLVGLDFAPVDAEPIELEAAAELPAALDWRDAGGNFVTGPKNQKKCGSCWAFSMTGGLESYTLLKKNTPGQDLDLSEQVMLSCSGAGSCKGGRLSAGYLQKTGLPLESAYPYTGPLPIAYMVYEDFMHYKSGIYSYTTGKRLGGHAVLLVGYNDAEKYFSVKNSWDTTWGEQGFFRIAYSQMDNSVNFGLSTIAYRAAKDEVPAGEAARAGAWSRVAPLFEGASAWK